MGDLIVMIALGLLFSALGFLVGIDMADDHMVHKKYISESIEQCEYSLPREEFCTLIAVPEREVK